MNIEQWVEQYEGGGNKSIGSRTVGLRSCYGVGKLQALSAAFI